MYVFFFERKYICMFENIRIPILLNLDNHNLLIVGENSLLLNKPNQV